MMTVMAISINEMTPDGISAANVPPKIMAAEMTTLPIWRAASTIISLGLPTCSL